MSFPSAADISATPHLEPWLVGRMWHRNGEFIRGLVDDVVVESIQCGTPEEDDETVFRVKSRDTRRRRFRTNLILFEQHDSRTRSITLDCIADCSCDEVIGCRHAVAAFEKLRSIVTSPDAKSMMTPQVQQNIDNWLQRLELATASSSPPPPIKPQKPYTKFLAYCIEEGFDRYGAGASLQIVLRLGSNGKNGRTLEKGIVRIDLTNPKKYMAEEDHLICLKLEQLRRQQGMWGQGVYIQGAGWDEIMEAMLATGRLFASVPNEDEDTRMGALRHIQISPGPDLPVTASWLKLDTGTAIPILDFSTPNSTCELLQTKPPRYLDYESGHLGMARSHLPDEVLRIWENGPPIPTAGLEKVGRGLAKIADKITVPLPDNKPAIILRDIAPKPVLLITEIRIGVYQKSHIGALLQFEYGDTVLYPLVEGAPAQATWYEGDKRYQLERDVRAEAEYTEALAAHGFKPLHAIFPASDLNDKTRHSVVMGEPSMSLTPWLDFLTSPKARAMEEQGWSIQSDTKLNLAIHDMGDFFPEIEQDSDHGIDWFRFDVTGEFEGKKISLIPHIAHAIRNDWLSLHADPQTCPESLLLPCDNPRDGHIRFPASRFLAMVEQVRHLFHGGAKTDGPLRMDRMHAAGVADALGVDTSETTRALAQLGRNLRDIQGLPATELPSTIHAQLRPYQLEGFRWLQFLARNGLHGILADDMGLGKTLQTLAHLAAEKEHAAGRPSLVIAPTSVVPNWAAEAEKFAPDLKVLVLHGSERGDHFDNIARHDLVFTTYPLLARDFDVLRKQDWHALVLDEAQYIKNPKALSNRCACQLRAAHRICLSGTPMENHLGDLWSLMRFLMPGFLADEKTFNAFIRRPIEKDRSQDAQAALNRRVSPLILRRTKDQVAAELPEKTTLVHRIDLEGRQTDLYESVRAAMDERVRDALADKGLAKSHIIVLDALLKLRQICCHPQLLKSEAAQRVTESAKLEFLTQELLPTLIEEGRRILLFSQFTSMLELIEEHLVTQGVAYLKLTGQTKERADLVRKFQAGQAPVFLISLKAGGTGLNLTAADTVIHYDPWWNPAAENQATDRAHRIGQMKPIFVHKLVCSGTIEERILELQQQKAALVEALLSNETSKLTIDADTLSHLFSPIG